MLSSKKDASMASKIPIDHRQLTELCRRRHIRRLAIFGSVLRNDFGPASDVDVLAELEPDHVPGLDFFLIEEEVSSLLGRRVDLNTPGFLGPELLGRVLAEAEVQFVQS
jgi:predicted nucleotidyltransferase